MEKIKTHRDLNVFRLSSRSVPGNIAEAFRKRKYPESFASKLSHSEGEAAETQVWPDYALNCKYIDDTRHFSTNEKYDHINAMLVKMSLNPENLYYFGLSK